MVWAVITIAAVATLGFFEWRSRNKPLARGLEDTPMSPKTLPTHHEDLNKPHD